MTDSSKRRRIRQLVKQQAEAAAKLSDRIADLAEPGFKEAKSAEGLTDYLAQAGFLVEFLWPQMPTAFKATWGHGKPCVGLLAEYDALPECGIKNGTWGHGCGHNLLGVGAAVGGVAAKNALTAMGLTGSVVVWGCPAEEAVAGKVYMARDGAFRDDDAILGWHPGATNAVGRKGGAAMDSLVFEFVGKTAHATSAHLGRSALDGVMLLDVAANYLREHVPENVRIHMCIRDGGQAPNVVPAYAKCWYYVRAKNRAQVDHVRKRLVACARGAAMATETKVRVKHLTGVYERLENDVMGDLVQANFELFGPPSATREDKASVVQLGKKPVFDHALAEGKGAQGRASSDEDNVSWLAPFGRFSVACTSREEVAIHHRDFTAQMKLPFAHRGMLRTAEIFAGAVVDLCADPDLLKRAKVEFRKRTKGFTYDPLVGKRQRPPTVAP